VSNFSLKRSFETKNNSQEAQKRTYVLTCCVGYCCPILKIIIMILPIISFLENPLNNCVVVTCLEIRVQTDTSAEVDVCVLATLFLSSIKL
jgi:hypothetical protein